MTTKAPQETPPDGGPMPDGRNIMEDNRPITEEATISASDSMFRRDSLDFALRWSVMSATTDKSPEQIVITAETFRKFLAGQ